MNTFAPDTSVQNRNAELLKRYYRVHSKIYDLTRWSFLFGRTAVIRELQMCYQPSRILEIGCGTGKNLTQLCRTFPDAEVIGLDLSEAMLAVARRNVSAFRERVKLIPKMYDRPLSPAQAFDCILCSYSLSMMNPGWERVLESAVQDLAHGGVIAVVDFHDSAVSAFKHWMGLNHVRLDGHLLPKLQEACLPKTLNVRQAYLGIWEYMTFVGEKSQDIHH